MKLKPLNQQVVVVFGASSGIGRETALRFARKGATVVVAARGGEGLETLVEEITRNGGEAAAIVADAADADQVKAVADLTVRQYGHLDTWVHAAAVAVYAPFEQTTPEEFAQVITVNLTGQAYGAMAALPYLRESGGALIHISSVEAKRPLPLHSAYAASKHGVHGFVETLRMELQHDKAPVSVTEILPASINTPFFNHARTKIGVKPMGPPPIYEPGIVADAILYAATHPVREMLVGGAGKAMVASQRVSSRMTDALFTRVGYPVQKTKEPRSEDAPDDVFAPATGDYRTQGDFTKHARSKSVDTWFGTHPLARMALITTAIAGAVLLARRNRIDRDENNTESFIKASEIIVVETSPALSVDAVPPIDGEAGMPPMDGDAALPSSDGAAVTLFTEEPEIDPEATVKIILDRP